MSGLYFTSDQHFGHHNVIKYCSRPFSNVMEMNDTLVERYNAKVGSDGFCYHVGDFSLALSWVDLYGPKLVGERVLVPGNHDWCHSCHSRKEQKVRAARGRFKAAGFKVLDEQITVYNSSLKMKVCHLPYWEEPMAGEKPRYREIRPVPEDESFLICGHVHQNWRVRKHPSGKLMYNVGVDVHNFEPVKMSDILKTYAEYKDCEPGMSFL
jgi:calcineurin-like phosphoesterase family protein